MSNLPVRSSFSDLLPSKLDRQTSREIARAQAYSAALSAREVAKVEAVADVTETALIAVSNVAAFVATVLLFVLVRRELGGEKPGMDGVPSSDGGGRVGGGVEVEEAGSRGTGPACGTVDRSGAA